LLDPTRQKPTGILLIGRRSIVISQRGGLTEVSGGGLSHEAADAMPHYGARSCTVASLCHATSISRILRRLI